MSLLGIDIGTTGTKAVAFSADGKVLATAYREYPLIFPKPGWIELDSARVIKSVREAIREAASKTKPDPVRALAVAAQGEAVTPVGKDGAYLHNAIVTFDARTAPLVGHWEERISRKRIYQITGMPLHGMYTASKILWWRKNRPDVFRDARYFLCFEDLLFHELGLGPAIDPSLAARTMLYDIDRRAWSEELLKIAGVEADRLARTTSGVVGIISARASKEFGLPLGVVAVTGGHDQPCGALGAGVVESNVGMYATGTVECITPAFNKRADLLKANIACYPHVVRDLYVALTFNFTGGSLLKWYRDTFGGEEKRRAARSGRDVYELLIEEASKEPTSLMVLPHFTSTGTPHFDTRSKGVIAGLQLSTTKGEIIRAILEGVTYEMALNVKLLPPIDSFRAIGGGAKSPVWMQIKADLLGRPVSAMRVTEAVCLGAAILAGSATGVYRTPQEAAKKLSRVETTYRPNEKNVKVYRERFALYRELYPALSGLLHQL
jgi:xylulokinase